ncbi:saccharopine dehydrogenase [Helicobacter pullorum]|uniref:Saccharopine dehydrogenase n=1 Tax=Helicobacter pullorum TaxID=35818 RepID=A0AAW3J2C4_9HELI|nr:saccharopine dehydrogenase family protein [Helicobacter pullorum]KPH50186.1 saccharopine dehydrogenase [Helicobacter pullorum]
MACVLQIGAGGVGGVVAHKMAMNKEVFSRIVLASRNIAKCAAIADSIRAKGLGEIEIDSVDADNVDEIVALIEKYKPFLVVNVALPYQDLSIMQACLRTKTHYLDTANYEHPDSAHFEYKEQWAYDTRYKQAGIFALLGSGFDPGVTNVFCAYAQKHYFDEIHTIDILDCNAGDHGYAFATNFNPEINLREVSSKARYWVKNSSLGNHLQDFANFEAVITDEVTPAPKSAKNSQSTTANTRICEGDIAESIGGGESASDLESSSLDSNLALNPDLKKDEIYRKFEREEKHFALESNTQDLKNESYFGGQWRDVAPLALMKEWEYPEVGVKNSYLLYHEELESLIRNIKGLKRIRFFMTFGESYLTHMKCLENVGLLRVDEVEHNGQKIVPIQVLKTLLPDPASLAPRTKGQTHIGCYIKGMKDGKERTIYIYNICEHEACYKEVNAQGVSYTTGVPAMIGAKLICEGKWGVGSNSSLTQDTRIAESSYAQERLALNADMPQGGEYQGIDNATELQNLARTNGYSQSGNAAGLSMNFEGCQARGEGSLVSLNDQAECDDSLKSRDKTTQGAGVWNMEQNDPDPFMRELNKQGLPYVVLEIDSNEDSKVLEDGRK